MKVQSQFWIIMISVVLTESIAQEIVVGHVHVVKRIWVWCKNVNTIIKKTRKVNDYIAMLKIPTRKLYVSIMSLDVYVAS